MRRVFILGLDGTTWDILTPLTEAGIMPRLKALAEAGARGTLMSVTPPTTPPAWTSCVTGLNPGRHGIYDFTVSPLADPKRPLVTGRMVRGEKLWHIFNRHGGRAVVVNVPVTYPPEPLDGVMISGMMTPGPEAPYTYPPDVKTRLKAVCGNYIPNIDLPKYDPTVASDAFRFLDDLNEALQRRREAVRHLMDTEAWRFFMAVFILPDRIQHLFYKLIHPDIVTPPGSIRARLRERIHQAYRALDDVIGELADRLDDDTTLLVVSDHGFGGIDGYFFVNEWLRETGYLRVHPGPYRKRKAFFTVMRLGDTRLLRKLLPEPVQAVVRRAIRRRRSTLQSAKLDLESVVDWEATQAFFASIPTQGIYINERVLGSDAAVRRVAERLRESLMSVRHPTDGEPLMDDVRFREEIYHGPEVRYAPHLLIKMRNYAVLGRQHLGVSDWFRSMLDSPAGFHRPDGIIIARGPGIKSGHTFPNAGIIDITPTALYSAGLPVPDNLDGQLIREIFDADHIEQNPLITETGSPQASGASGSEPVYNKAEQQIVSDRLRSLGYLE